MIIFDYVYLFSPTYYNNPKYHLLDDMRAELIVEPDFDKNRFAEIKDAIDARIEDWKKHEEYKIRLLLLRCFLNSFVSTVLRSIVLELYFQTIYLLSNHLLLWNKKILLAFSLL